VPATRFSGTISGLYSRWFFYERLGEELARCGRYGRVSSLVCLSFPDWKTLDISTQGQIVERIGYLLQHELRYSDVAARWGPGRFVWYLPETDAPQGRRRPPAGRGGEDRRGRRWDGPVPGRWLPRRRSPPHRGKPRRGVGDGCLTSSRARAAAL
jgi:hypothetical protein